MCRYVHIDTHVDTNTQTHRCAHIDIRVDTDAQTRVDVQSHVSSVLTETSQCSFFHLTDEKLEVQGGM